MLLFQLGQAIMSSLLNLVPCLLNSCRSSDSSSFFRYLAKHKNNKKYSAVIDKLYATLANTNTFDGLLPIFLSPISGEAKGGAFSMGASSDSYYEYLLKTWIQGGKKNEV